MSGATVRRPKAGRMQTTRGNRSFTGSLRAASSARRCRAAGVVGQPLEARTEGAAVALGVGERPHERPTASLPTASGTCRGRRPGGRHPRSPGGRPRPAHRSSRPGGARSVTATTARRGLSPAAVATANRSTRSGIASITSSARRRRDGGRKPRRPRLRRATGADRCQDGTRPRPTRVATKPSTTAIHATGSSDVTPAAPGNRRCTGRDIHHQPMASRARPPPTRPSPTGVRRSAPVRGSVAAAAAPNTTGEPAITTADARACDDSARGPRRPRRGGSAACRPPRRRPERASRRSRPREGEGGPGEADGRHPRTAGPLGQRRLDADHARSVDERPPRSLELRRSPWRGVGERLGERATGAQPAGHRLEDDRQLALDRDRTAGRRRARRATRSSATTATREGYDTELAVTATPPPAPPPAPRPWPARAAEPRGRRPRDRGARVRARDRRRARARRGTVTTEASGPHRARRRTRSSRPLAPQDAGPGGAGGRPHRPARSTCTRNRDDDARPAAVRPRRPRRCAAPRRPARATCTTRSTADASCSRTAASGRPPSASSTIVSRRRSASSQAVGVAGRQRALVAGVHGLQHVEGLAAADLADDDAVGSHAQRVADELPDPHLARLLRRSAGRASSRTTCAAAGAARPRPRR